MFSRIFCVAGVVLSALTFRGAAEDNTETRLSKYGQELSAAWADYPSEKDVIVRKQKINDLNSAAGSEIPKLSAPENITVQKSIDNFMSNLQKIRPLFKQDKMSTERQQYASMCGTAFRRELNSSTDAADPRTATKCFEMLIEWAEAARTGLHTVPDELHQPLFAGLLEAFNLMLKTATKDADDPTAIYDRQLKEIKRKFPTASPVFQKTNQPIVLLLEGAAKAVNALNKKP